MSKKFKRQDYMRSHKLGRKKRKVAWRKPKGRHSKMRKQRKSYPAKVLMGYRASKKESGRINSLKPLLVFNKNDLLKLGKDSIAIIAHIGKKKKLEIIKLAQEKNIKILNVKGKAK